jgi:chromosomal replication initiation ATPase DnaA
MITRVYQIADRVCHSMGIDPDDLRGPSRSERLLLARRIIAYQAKLHGFSFPDIAQIVRGSRSKHATIMGQFAYAEQCPRVQKAAAQLFGLTTSPGGEVPENPSPTGGKSTS